MAVLPPAFAEAGLEAERIGRNDLADLERMHRDPVVMAHMGGLRDAATTAAFLERNMAHWDRHGFGIYALRTPDGRFVGRAGLRWVEPVGRRGAGPAIVPGSSCPPAGDACPCRSGGAALTGHRADSRLRRGRSHARTHRDL